jgi:hypothetical protein
LATTLTVGARNVVSTGVDRDASIRLTPSIRYRGNLSDSNGSF